MNKIAFQKLFIKLINADNIVTFAIYNDSIIFLQLSHDHTSNFCSK